MNVFSLNRIIHERNPSATMSEIDRLTARVGPLPATYIEFLRLSNGAEFSNSSLVLWPTADVLELNDAYEFARYTPTLLAIGSDGGGMAIGLDRQPHISPESWPVVGVKFGDLDPESFVMLAGSISAWADDGFTIAAAA